METKELMVITVMAEEEIDDILAEARFEDWMVIGPKIVTNAYLSDIEDLQDKGFEFACAYLDEGKVIC